MSKATRSDLVAAGVADYAIGYSQDTDRLYLAPRLPEGAILRVGRKDGKIYKWDKGDMLRIDAQLRGAGSGYARSGVALGTVAYACKEYGLEQVLDDGDVLDFSNEGPDLQMQASAKIMGNIFAKRDALIDSKVMLTGVWSTDYDGVTGTPSTNEFKRFDASGSTPLTTIPLIMDAVQDACGRRPNVALVGRKVWTQGLAYHSDIRDLYKYTEGGPLTEEMVAGAFGLDALLVGDATYNSAAEGATASLAQVLQPKDMWLGYISNLASALEPSAFKIVSFEDEANARGVTLDTYRDESIRSDVMRGRAFFDVVVTAADAGAFLEDSVS